MNQAERWKQKHEIYERLVSQLEKFVLLRREWIIAEFGVGKWGFAKFYNERVRKVYGIDVEDYRRHHPEEIEFLLSDGLSIPMADETVDMVVSHSVLEHVQDLDASLSEINRITKTGGYFFLTVSPLYYSGYGAHLKVEGQRLENWDHLRPDSPYHLMDNPMPGAKTVGHSLNGLTSSMFLGAVGRLPWNIISYQLSYEKRSPPEEVAAGQYPLIDLVTSGFIFVGQKNKWRKSSGTRIWQRMMGQ